MKVPKENATEISAASKKVSETTEAPERHVADAAYGLTGRVAATLVDESTLGEGQRLHDAANRSRVADVAVKGGLAEAARRAAMPRSSSAAPPPGPAVRGTISQAVLMRRIAPAPESGTASSR